MTDNETLKYLLAKPKPPRGTAGVVLHERGTLPGVAINSAASLLVQAAVDTEATHILAPADADLTGYVAYLGGAASSVYGADIVIVNGREATASEEMTTTAHYRLREIAARYAPGFVFVECPPLHEAASRRMSQLLVAVSTLPVLGLQVGCAEAAESPAYRADFPPELLTMQQSTGAVQA